MFVYCQFPNRQADVFEFSPEAHWKIAAGNLDPLLDAGVTGFFRVTVEDEKGFREVWSNRNKSNRR
jgi:hypothetical protein